MYGTRDAAFAWKENYVEWLVRDLIFVRSAGCQHAFYNADRSLRAMAHGDDFLTAGPENEADKLKTEMDTKYEAKHTMIGPDDRHEKTVKVRNRELRGKLMPSP